MSTVLSLDPGTLRTGYAVYRGSTLVHSGVIHADQKHRPSRRIEAVVNAVTALDGEYALEVVVVELLPSLKGRRDYVLRTLTDELVSWGKRSGLRVVTVTPAQWRASIVGNGKASKEETIGTLRLRYMDVPTLRAAGSDELEACGIGDWYVRSQTPAGRVEAAAKGREKLE